MWSHVIFLTLSTSFRHKTFQLDTRSQKVPLYSLSIITTYYASNNGLIWLSFLKRERERETFFSFDILYLFIYFLVEAVGCDPKTLRLTVEDPSFMIQSNGVIVALSPVSVATRGRTFSVRAQDNSGPESEMEVHLVCSTKQETNVRKLQMLY